MKNVILFLTFVLMSSPVWSQRVDIDKKRVSVEVSTLPQFYVPTDQRTYVVEFFGPEYINPDYVYENININGWEQVDENANAKVVINAYGIKVKDPEQIKRTEEKKDKEGNVTSTKHYYKYTLVGETKSRVRVSGPGEKMEMSKWEKKQKAKAEAEAAEKKEAVDSNPFLAGTDVADEADQNANLEVIFGDYNNHKFEYTTAENSSYSKALAAIRAVIDTKVRGFEDDYPEQLVRYANSDLNTCYGYQKSTQAFKMRVLDSKKHPENEMYGNATTALQKLMEAKKWNESTDKLKTDLEPMIAYFEGVAKKYSSDDKHEKRLKSASLFNLGQIYYFLDMPDKVKEIGDSYIRWGEDVKDGEDFVEMAESLKKQLEFHNMSGRYFTAN